MRILNIIDNLNLVGGAQNQELQFVQALRGRGHDLTVLSLENDLDSPIAELMRNSGARVDHLPGKSLMDIGRFWRLYRYIKDGSFDIVHTHLSFANILGNTAGWLAGTKVVTTLHNERFFKRRYYAIKSRLESFLLRQAAADVMACGYSAGEANRPRLNGKPIHVFPNSVAIPKPISAQERTAIRTRLAGDPNRPLVITIGRLTPQKGYSDLLDGFTRVVARFPQAKLLIVGRGGLHDTLQSQIERLGLEDQVELLGARTDVTDLLAASDMYVNSSHWEGLSKAMLEAMAAGLPVVATRVGDAPYVVVEETGCLVMPGAVNELAEAMSALLADPERMRAYGAAARQHIARHYDPITWSENILEIYRQAISGKPANASQKAA